MTALTKKGREFQWSEQAQRAFNDLKREFSKEPILAHFDPDLKIVVETDASDFVAAGILS